MIADRLLASAGKDPAYWLGKRDLIMTRTLLITGASSGIGAACARLAAARGQHLLLHYGRNIEGVQVVADEARTKGAEVTF